MTPLQRYQQDVQSGKISSDPQQLAVLQHLQTLYFQLQAGHGAGGLLARLKWLFAGRQPGGIYLWGGVGRGKTYLVDIFFDCLPFRQKSRIHFHRFMQQVHRWLQQHKNQSDPLQAVADNLARRVRVICLDEFQVEDITDAMLLAGLLTALFDRGVSLVTTSNVEPDRLYWDGLQRARFLPAIALLKRHTQVLQINVDTDYRLRYLDQATTFHHPLGDAADAALEQAFTVIAPDTGRRDADIKIENRKLRTRCLADGVVWFEFRELCDGPRGAADYIEIARQFQTVLISNVIAMDDQSNDIAKRFITLVDEFYDRNVKLILSAAVAVPELYQGRRLAEGYKRTHSRLIEMQTHAYLARPHLAQ
ncbi:MAG: cell division protein ZapE [Gammaproteobacteria bacterium]